MLAPSALLLALVVLTVAAAALSHLARGRRSAAVAALAAQWSLRFLHDDRFNLAPRVATALPVPGAADVVVRDLIYGPEPHPGDGPPRPEPAPHMRYFFTVEYTVGVIRGKRRHVAVGTLTESRNGSAGATYSRVTLAPPGIPVIDQYRHLGNSLAPPSPPTA